MSFFAICLRRPVGVVLIMLSLFGAGVLAYFLLPVASLPKIDYPTIVVSATLPGAEPETMASAVAAPLERRLGQIAGITELTSSSALGTTAIVVQFDLGRSIDAAARDVQAAISAASADLPSGLPYAPTWRKTNPSAAPVMILAVTSSVLPPGKVYEAADTILAQRLSQVEGVGQVTVNGAAKPAVRVRLDPTALAAMGLGSEGVRSIVAAANASGPKGRIDGPTQAFMIHLDDQLPHAADYEKLIVANAIRLRDVATVADSVENVRLAGWFDAQPAVLVFVFKEANANVVETVDRIRGLIPALRAWLPSGVDLSVMSDRTRSIRASLREVQILLLISVTLIAATVVIFLRRLWAAAAAAVTVPLTIAGTLAAMQLLGYSLDNLSLMALTIATGFVIDDAIVVIEAISLRMSSRKERPMRAAFAAAHQIGFTVVSISVSLVAVFIPLLFMGGIIGRLFREFSITLSIAIGISAVVSLTLIPVMAAYLAPARAVQERADRFERVVWLYDRMLRVVLRHRRLALVATSGTALAAAVLYINIPKGFFPQQDIGTIMATAEGPPTISFQGMTGRIQALINVLLQDSAVAHVGSYTGVNGGSSLNQARIFIDLKPRAERQDRIPQIVARLRAATSGAPGVALYMVPVQDVKVGGRISKSEYQYTLSGPNPSDLTHWVGRLVDRLRADPDFLDVTTDLEDNALALRLVIDRDLAFRLGVQPLDIDQVLNNAFGQRVISSVYAPYYTYHVVLEADPELQAYPSSLAKIFVGGPAGRQVPLTGIVRINEGLQPITLAHQGQSPAVTVTFALRPGVALQRGTERIDQVVKEIGLPADIHGSFQAVASVFAQSLRSQPLLIAAALVTVFIVLGVLYESAIHPWTILSTLPSAGIGALLALWAFGRPLDVVGIIGIILLIGIVKKNAIMMIDYALVVEREHDRDPEQAILEACRLRLRPILMTTLTAMLGAIPLAIGGGEGAELRQPLGIAIVGGLLVSQILTLFTTPLVYLTLDGFRRGDRHRAAPPRLFRSRKIHQIQ